MPGVADEFANDFLRELEALRRDGRQFSEDHPKVAGRLRLEDVHSPDPHVERLLEAFAFLTARVQRKLDDDHVHLSSSLLEVLYPHLVRPVPSMAIVEFELDMEQSLPPAGRPIPRGTTLLTQPVRGHPLKFRTTTDATLWPVSVSGVAVEVPDATLLDRQPDARSVLRIDLAARGEHPFGVLKIEHLLLHLKGEPRVVHDLYGQLVTRLIEVSIDAGGGHGSLLTLPRDVVTAEGFADDQAALPYPRRSFTGYRLLQEYFAFPEKFHFLRVAGLDRLGTRTNALSLRFVFDTEFSADVADIGRNNFSLSSVPIVNLFEATADPILVSPLKSEYDVVPDSHRPLDMETYSVERVVGVSSRSSDRLEYRPFYSLGHGHREGPQAFWHARRRKSQRLGDKGSELSLALVQLDMSQAELDEQTLHLDLLCTNRDVPSTLAQWGRADDFIVEGVTGIQAVRCLGRPTEALRVDLVGSAQWRLVSELALNYLSIVQDGRDDLREILRVYDFADTPASRQQIEGVLDVRSEPIVRRLSTGTSSGFCRGHLTTLTLDRAKFVGSSPILFAAIIERFLALYCSINAFSQLQLETPQDQGVIHAWRPRAGEQVIL